MSLRTSAARYARALFDVASAEADIDQVARDLEAVQATIGEHDELRQVLVSPSVPEAARRNVAVAVADRLAASAPVQKLLAMLAERRRLDLLPDLIAAYRERLQAHRQVVEASVTTAAPLSADAEAALGAALSDATGRRVDLRITVDPTLLGGLVARVGSTVYDGSVRTQLRRMRERLVAEI
jgi:F-type H+-transporting ATPase subunit delta